MFTRGVRARGFPPKEIGLVFGPLSLGKRCHAVARSFLGQVHRGGGYGVVPCSVPVRVVPCPYPRVWREGHFVCGDFTPQTTLLLPVDSAVANYWPEGKTKWVLSPHWW